jgi:cytochrome c oxidase subunit 4
MVDSTANADHEGLSPARSAMIYVGLLILTVATYSFSRFHLGTWSVVIAMVIAIFKASLVVLFFMQLWYHHGSVRLALATAVLWLFLLTFFVVADVKSRYPLTNPNSNPLWQPPTAAPGGSPGEHSRPGRP